MQDLNALAQSLIDALKRSTQSSIDLMGIQRRNFFEDGLNKAARRGTLYSGANAAQQTRYEGATYLPSVTQARSKSEQQQIGIKTDLLNTQRKIDAQNRAAAELNGITFDHLLE